MHTYLHMHKDAYTHIHIIHTQTHIHQTEPARVALSTESIKTEKLKVYFNIVKYILLNL